MSNTQTLLDLLDQQASQNPAKMSFRYLPVGTPEGCLEWSYEHLERYARRVAVALQERLRVGDRALLLFAPGLDFIGAYFGCIYAGVVAVPTYPPDPNQLPKTLPRLQRIAQDAQVSAVLTTHDIAMLSTELGALLPELASLVWLSVDGLPNEENRWKRPSLTTESVAFLQYTSGSTSEPKGVVITHQNILANQEMITRGMGSTPEDSGVGWLPLFHDMGLIGNVLQAVYLGVQTTLMSPLVFLKHPLRWLQAISHYQGTICGGPNFAFDLCARRVTPEQLAALDLRSWRVAYNGAEPIHAPTLHRFAQVFAPAGFSAKAFYPTYGLAEATLFVTGKPHQAPPTFTPFDIDSLERGVAQVSAQGRTLVGCGAPHPQTEVLIVDPETRSPISDSQIGEIWVRGDNVARGYYKNESATKETFGALLSSGEGPYLRTGDLGFFLKGELYITGRRKDVIIVRGRNVHPQDIERLAEAASPCIRPGCCAAFSISEENEEKVVLVAEAQGDSLALKEAQTKIQEALSHLLEVSIKQIVFLPPRSLPKTSSGKLRRSACREAFLHNTFEEVLPVAPNQEETLKAHILERLAGLLQRPISSLRPEATLASLGVDSLQAAQLAGELEQTLSQEIPPEIFFGQTVAQVAHLLAEGKTQPLAGLLESPKESDYTLPRDLAPQQNTKIPDGPIFVTGATGFLGSHLVANLLAYTNQEIFCLVRAATPREGATRLKEALARIGRWKESDAPRLRALTGALSQPRLGLSSEVFTQLSQSLSAIYHCAAVVHWSSAYASLRAVNVEPLDVLLRLAAPNNLPLHYVSSLGVYPLHSDAAGVFPEEAPLSGVEHLHIGYFQSKWVAEKRLEEARKRGFRVSIYRPGVITGDSQSGLDYRPEEQLFYSFLRGCIELGSVPLLDKVLDVVPVDYVARAIASLSLQPASWGRSFNLLNPTPMRQLDCYQALRALGYSLKELPYSLWREEVLSLPKKQPQNPLARFALYYRGLTERRMRRFEARTSRALPVQAEAAQTLLPNEVKCPAFDQGLLATYLRSYQQRGLLTPPSKPQEAARQVHFIENYQREDEALDKLYERAKKRQWDGGARIDWSLPLDPENPQSLPDSGLPLYGSALFDSMSREDKGHLRRHFQAWQLSQFLHGEQGALLCAAKLVEQSPSMEAKLYAATQAMDEARHVEVFSRLLQKIGLSYSLTAPLKELLDQILRDSRWDITALGMQVLVEGLALSAFSLTRDQSQSPLIKSINAYVIEDEARHVAFGRMSLKDFYPALSEKERAEREELVVEASYLLRDRFVGAEVWEALGLPVDVCVQHIHDSGFLRTYRAELFSRTVPVVKAIGLFGPKVKKAYGAMGVLGFAHIDVDALAVEDEKISFALERSLREGGA